ncbi:uncharacterized protein LOC128192079 [Crassostrea angulata]|uniref:uncharacterized protein LOC128192079 n=1 Tax=Magallana angulata TaxID=2784310 RepID=UPI0022B10D08|nr:uncharacterized protein LOC128192079 [Crassostrea angulata]
MKKRKSNRIKKYMVLFCIVLVSVVVSTVLAGYIGSKSVEKDIPDETSQELQKMPEREFLEMLYSNLTEIKSALQLDLKNESKMVSELVLQRFLNETDFISWKKYLNKKIHTIIFSLVCVHNCTNHDDGDYQSCNTCNGYVSCGGHVLLNRDCPSTLVWDNSSTCDPKHLPS